MSFPRDRVTPLPWLRMAYDRRRIPATREAIEAYRLDRLKQLVAHAVNHVPYYRRLFEQAGVSLKDIQTLADIEKLPVTTKSDLRACPADTLSDAYTASKLRKKFTSGSSGEPFCIRRSRWESGIATMLFRRSFRDYGTRLTDKTAVISLFGGLNQSVPLMDRAVHAARRFVDRRWHLHSGDDPFRLIAQLEKIQPDVILAYAGILAKIGELLTEEQRVAIRPRFLLSGSETLTPLRRRQIEEGFGARVYDFYAAYEAGLMAWECPTTGLYHVLNDHVIMELERDGRVVPWHDGEQGATLVTNLHAWSMPFIRYRLADVVVCGPSRCPCGAPFPTLRSIEGRWIDYIMLPDGRHVHPIGIARAFVQSCPGIRQWQLVQETPDRIRVRVVLMPETQAHIPDEIIRRVREYVRVDLDVQVDVSDRIDPEGNGKFKLFVSHVTSR